ncbi:MAG TPA: hypothetical protein VMN56_16520 [Casimicrobiaceae bacterium]|nr:hypothetical protein [Casimicrobiaceae bacterium]
MSDDAPEALRTSIASRFAVRLHCALILLACFGVGLFVTHLLLAAGVDTMWLRYALALFAAYLTFLLGVRIWLWYAGYDRRILPSRGCSLLDNADLPSVGGGGGGGSGSAELPVFRGGGGSSGGGGASLNLDGTTMSAGRTSAGFFSGSHGGGSGGGGFDLGDDGWVLIALIAVLLAVSGAVVWLIYAAPTILADAAFAAMLSAGLAKSTRHIASGGWVASVVGHTWIAFGFVFVLALAFAIAAQHKFPEARTLADVWRLL